MRKKKERTHWITIDGAIEIPEGVSLDECTEKLEAFLTDHGWHIMAAYGYVEEENAAY